MQNNTCYLSCDVNLPVSLKIEKLLGQFDATEESPTTWQRELAEGQVEFYVTAELYSQGFLIGSITRTTMAPPQRMTCVTNSSKGSSTSTTFWSQWLTLPVKYRDLPCGSWLSLRLWEAREGAVAEEAGGGKGGGGGGSAREVGRGKLGLFTQHARLRTGVHRVRVWPMKGGVQNQSTAEAKLCTEGNEEAEVKRLEKLWRGYGRGAISSVPWLDPLALQKTQEVMRQAEEHWATFPEVYMVVELPRFDTQVLFQEPPVLFSSSPSPFAIPNSAASGGAGRSVGTSLTGVLGGGENEGEGSLLSACSTSEPRRRMMVAWVVDTEVGLENPAVAKQLKVARGLARGVIDQRLRPDAQEQKEIRQVLALLPTRPLPAGASNLLWKFRFSLKQDKTALTKFLKCVDWSDTSESSQAVELMHQWAQIDTADALQLLSASFTNPEVRAHAVAMLERTSDEELLSYLLQLVQALRHEASDENPLMRFLIQRCTAPGPNNRQLGNFLHWFVSLEREDPVYASRFFYTHQQFMEALLQTAHGQRVYEGIQKQCELTSQLGFLVQEVGAIRGNTRKVERLRALLDDPNSARSFVAFEAMPLPLEPRTLICGVIPAQSSVFKSAMAPLKITFRTCQEQGEDRMEKQSPKPQETASTPGACSQRGDIHSTISGGGGGGGGDHVAAMASLEKSVEKCVVIFKKGDDLRQDQLCIQMIGLMDSLLKAESLDLHLTPYSVLATGPDSGMLQFVPSRPLATILAEHRTISRFLSLENPDPAGPFGIQAEVLDRFVKSCAGYCVITYILGVGDRHLDNLLLASDGRLFHIDFGYIMGRDPKVLPPPMKLCKEMVEAMGGTESEHYVRFKTYCVEAYNILRKSALLVINLFLLMCGANIPDIPQDPEKTILKLESKFALNLDDEAAVQHFQALIQESANALFPQMMETAHRWAQYWR